MWVQVSESVAGTSHFAGDIPCQDASLHGVVGHGEDEIALFVVSDGAGSASHSHLGSRVACNRFVEFCHENQPRLNASIDRNFADELLTALLTAIVKEAEAAEVEPTSLACTFLAAIVGRDWTFFVQLGDGAIVHDTEDSFGCAFWPMSGEYANITTFITSPTARDTMMSATVPRGVQRVAVFTDGLQLLALDFQAKKPFAPFFRPMFDFMATCADGSDVVVPLREFLVSPNVNSKTDDDKSLCLGVRKG